MSRTSRLSSLCCGVTLALLLALSFLLRTHFVHDRVFSGKHVRFSVHDPWYHVRLVENLVHHFPTPITFDPYAVFPGGQRVPVAPLFDWLLAAACLIAGGARPSTRTIEVVCAYAPAVLGTLIVVPVYYLGRQLCNRWTGLLAAGLIVISPGQLLSRSLLGYTDHHIAEVLLSVLTVVCVGSAIQRARREEATLPAVSHGPWKLGAVLASRGAVAGVVLGLYLLTWLGGSLFVGILLIWLTLQYVVDHVSGRAVDYLPVLAVPLFFVALLCVAPWDTDLVGRQSQLVALSAGIAVAIALAGLSMVAVRMRLPRWTFPLLTTLVCSVAVGTVFLWKPWLSQKILEAFGRFRSGHEQLMIPETAPLFKVAGQWSLKVAWGQFTTGLFLSLPGIVILALRGVRRGDARALLLCTWSVGMLAATLCQNRFAYYYAVSAAVLSAYVCVLTVMWGWRRLFCDRGPAAPAVWATTGEQTAKGAIEFADSGAPRFSSRRAKCTFAAVTGVAVFFLLLFPNLAPAGKAARRADVPHPDWLAAMHWMRENTPEPFGDPAAYYASYEPPPSGESYRYPDSAYGVLSSWGQGYWITRMAHRIPVANPGQHGAEDAAKFLMAQDPRAAGGILDRVGARYIAIDSTLPYTQYADGGVVGKIASLAHWSGEPLTTFSEQWYQRRKDGQRRPFAVCYPAYFRSMLVRLYVFRGQHYEPTEVHVLSFREMADEHGERYKELVTAKKFADYAEAKRYFDTQPQETTRIVSTSPYKSCVPLEGVLDEYRSVYRSPTVRSTPAGQRLPHVEIYEYLRADDRSAAKGD